MYCVGSAFRLDGSKIPRNAYCYAFIGCEEHTSRWMAIVEATKRVLAVRRIEEGEGPFERIADRLRRNSRGELDDALVDEFL